MTFDRTGFQRVLAHSGLTRVELALLHGVSKQTLYNWINGSEPAQPLISRHATAVIAGILAAIDARVLPLPPSLDAKKRKQRLNMMQQKLHQLAKPQPDQVQ